MANNPAAFGASSKSGTNTPIGRPKMDPALKKHHNRLKRSGSAHLSGSEASGNESARKKHKKKHPGSSQPSGAGTPRQMSQSPAPGEQRPRKSSIVTLPINGNKLSAIQSKAPHPASDAEMSDAGPRKPNGIRHRLGGSAAPSRTASPNGSRAGSPAAPTSELFSSHHYVSQTNSIQTSTLRRMSVRPFQRAVFQLESYSSSFLAALRGMRSRSSLPWSRPTVFIMQLTSF